MGGICRVSYVYDIFIELKGRAQFARPQTVDKVSKEALFFLAKNAEIWYNKVKKNK